MKTSVSRRYKHFNWLHNRLAETFPGVSIPPLPEKVLQGLYLRSQIGRGRGGGVEERGKEKKALSICGQNLDLLF